MVNEYKAFKYVWEVLKTKIIITKKSSRVKRFVKAVRRLALKLCFCVLIFVVLLMGALISYLIYRDQFLEVVTGDSSSADRLVAGTGDVDNPLSFEQMSDTQKFFLNIGIRQDHLIQDCTESQFKHSFPNIDYAFLGYDIYRGYPLTESHDPGFTFPIFRADYSEKRQSADCRFSVPNGVIAIPDVSCVTSFSSTTIETEQELAKSLSVSTEVSGGGFGASFSASFGYKKAVSSLSKENSVFVISSARCDYYFVKLRKDLAPTFDEAFLVWLSKLDKTDSNDTYIEFMDKFGTHFLTGATFGARFTFEHKMTSTYFKSTQNTQFNAAVRASYSGSFSVGGGFSLDSEQREAASEFSKNVETRTITVGAAPPSNGDAMTWASTVKNDPIPTKYTLEPMENLFVHEYVGTLGIDYDTIRQNILNYKKDYEKFREENSASIHLWGPKNGLDLWHYTKRTLSVAKGGTDGDWGPAEFCLRGTFAIGYNLKIQPDQGSGDDTGLNAIKLICADESGNIRDDVITSTQGFRGNYRKEDAICPQSATTAYFLTRFSLQMDDSSVGASFLTFKCQDIQHAKSEIQLEIPPGHGEPWGKEWHTSGPCPVGTAICGIKTKVEKDQGKKDDSGLNDVKFYCCGR